VPRIDTSAAAERRQQKVTTLTIELSVGQLDHYSKVAAAHGVPVDQWVKQVLDTADRQTA
jgi:alkylated DNA nucleotide flippase Atl1